MKKKASDFRYNTGEARVPWAAVGENYNVEAVSYTHLDVYKRQL